MQLLLGAERLASIGGMGTYLLTVAEQLERLGHDVVLFALDLGEMAEEARARGLVVSGRHEELASRPDAILAQDAISSQLLADAYPDVPQVFVAHGITFDLNLPPQLPGLVSTVVAMNDRVARRVRAGAAHHEPVRMRQPIDLDRFSPRGPARAAPRCVLALGNHLLGPRRQLLIDVCVELGLEYRQVGAHGREAHPWPELEIADADVVVGYGRAALEGMACGKAVYVFDHGGGDGWVTRESYPALEANGYAGSATPDVIDRTRLRADLLAYDQDMGLVTRELARLHHDAVRHVADLVPLLRTAPPPRLEPGAPLRELARLARVKWQVDGRAALFRSENQRLRERVDALERERDAERARAEEHGRKLAELKETRRYRLGARLAAPLDALRTRRRRGDRLLALVAFRDESRFMPGLLENLSDQVDGVIALDDGSTDGSAELVRGHALVQELLSVPPGAQDELEDGKNHRALVEASWRHAAGWLLGIDADERVECNFRERAEAEIARADRMREAALWVPFRELWGAPTQVRMDGIWGRKRKACLFRSVREHRFDERRVHAHWAPWPPARGDYPQADLRLYHLRMVRPEDRAGRVERYRRIDPEHEWQAIGYDYLLDEDGIELRPLEAGREYEPLGR